MFEVESAAFLRLAMTSFTLIYKDLLPHLVRFKEMMFRSEHISVTPASKCRYFKLA